MERHAIIWNITESDSYHSLYDTSQKEARELQENYKVNGLINEIHRYDKNLTDKLKKIRENEIIDGDSRPYTHRKEVSNQFIFIVIIEVIRKDKNLEKNKIICRLIWKK